MTLVFIVKDLVFEGPAPKTKDTWVPGIFMICIYCIITIIIIILIIIILIILFVGSNFYEHVYETTTVSWDCFFLVAQSEIWDTLKRLMNILVVRLGKW